MTNTLRQHLDESGLSDEFGDGELQALTVLLLSDIATSLQEISGLLGESASGSGGVQFSVYDHNSIDELPG